MAGLVEISQAVRTMSASTASVSALRAVLARVARMRPAALAGSAALSSRRLLASRPNLTARNWWGAALASRRGATHAAVVLANGATGGGAESGDGVEVEIKVGGMVCDGCSSRVQETLAKMPGVTKVEVDLEKGIASVQLETGSQMDAFNRLPALVDAVIELGFEASPCL